MNPYSYCILNNIQIFTNTGEVQLPAYNHSICVAPPVITDSTPTVLIANLNSAFTGCATTNKTNVTISALCCNRLCENEQSSMTHYNKLMLETWYDKIQCPQIPN